MTNNLYNLQSIAHEVVALTEYATDTSARAKRQNSSYLKTSAKEVAVEALANIKELEEQLKEAKATLRKIAR